MKVLVVDDSAVMRMSLMGMLHRAGHEVRVSPDGPTALEVIDAFDPDVVTLDVEMPSMDGLEVLRRIMSTRPRPVVMVSSLTTAGAGPALTALELGAVDVIGKPSHAAGGIQQVSAEIVRMVEAAAEARVSRSIAPRVVTPPPARTSSSPRRQPLLVIIGASTGGPRAVSDILTQLPAEFPAPIVVAIHMPERFTGPFADRATAAGQGLRVVEAATPVRLEPGTAVVARGGQDLVVDRCGGVLTARPTPSDPDRLWHPSVGRLVASAMTRVPADRLVAVQLTGMGDDGAEEMATVRARGGFTIAESRTSATVYGMPRALVELGGATAVLPRQRIRTQLLSWVATGVPT